MTQTLDPFSGVVYVQPSSAIRRGHQGPSHCRSEGRGGHEVGLEVNAGQCGWRRDGSRVMLNIYMQYDPHVQQVIDEQMVVECDMATRTGDVVDMGVRSSNHVMDMASVPLTAVQSFGLGTSWEQEEEDGEEEGAIADIVVGETILGNSVDNVIMKPVEVKTPIPSRLQESRRQRIDDFGPAVTGWLDISQDGKPIVDPLEGGQTVKLTAKVKQTNNMDTMLTRCMLASMTGDLIQLTDEFGCSLDRSLLTSFRSLVNDITGVKQTVGHLTVPTLHIGDRTETVKIKCNLAICQDNCPTIMCDRANQEPINIQDSIVLETQALFARREIMNVAEEVNHEISNLLGAEHDEGTLCLSQTRLVLAFGVLIIVIIASLLLSCYLWMKARKRMLPRPPIPIQRVPYMMPNRARPYIRVLT